MSADLIQILPRSGDLQRAPAPVPAATHDVSPPPHGQADSQARQRRDEPVYFSSATGLLAGWLHHPAAERGSEFGLVICKPFGYEALCGHRSIRAFAQMAAGLGIPALRFDYLGAGDSDDIDPGADQIETWIGDVQAAVTQMRTLTGVSRVCLMGIRLGAMLASLAVARGTEVSDLLLMAPVVSGKRYLRELRTTRLVNLPEATADPAPASDCGEFSGYEMSAATLATLARLDLTTAEISRVSRVLIMDRSDFPTARTLRDQLAAAGAEVEYSALPGFVEMSLVAPHYAVTPQEMLTTAQRWLSHLPGAPAHAPKDTMASGAAIFTAGRSSLRLGDSLEGPAPIERPVSLGGPTPLFGIVTEPKQDEKRRRAVILLNVGVDYHIGPSRMYVSLARRWARRGYYVLRVDLPGIGDSPALPGRPDDIVYAPKAVEHVYTAAEFMRSQYGIRDLTLAGVCSGAYHALRAAASGLTVERLLLVNPQTFFWKEGMSLDGVTTAEVVRNPMLYRRRLVSVDAWRRLLAGEVNLWRIFLIYLRRPWLSLESVGRECARGLGIRLTDDLGHDLESIVARGVRLAFAFSPGEVGHELLRLQGGSSVRKLGDRCRIRMLPSGDHTFSRRAPRLILQDVLSEELFACRDSPDAD